MENQKELAIDYFNRHQMSTECYITSDDRVFHREGMAQSFANTLDNKEVVKYSRESLTEEAEPVSEVEPMAGIEEVEQTEPVSEVEPVAGIEEVENPKSKKNKG
ncbi:MAG: hypothetical protein K2Q03_10330 [Sphingobacteriaceae bacterium]|nr:hypothetical protein [Sphingobacteriaceae bacterium]